uniref:Uncharacterized protein n=1 Tax=Candidatus Kentrum eta TaxID=2126337 RepID=A0A450VIH6_9GAMM|nr:MAG: hypothetical protein BECKH772B_GA0070898_101806 [Candidatus Kentron sp. H]VFK00205.1 MAG: hypothetical protein BECKH772A_GA0070896_101856 [Candidatus Kentron sp. H]VFK04589.1 MAG: hypothetical protein BECKH772C_GA0070978_101915 [Candidatus Kentron sp. H]
MVRGINFPPIVGLALLLVNGSIIQSETQAVVIYSGEPSTHLEQDGKDFSARTKGSSLLMFDKPGPGKSPLRGDLPGRLFFTQKQRRELDQRRDQYQEQKASVTEKEQHTLPIRSLTINGVVVRGNGNTLWINGEPVLEDSASQGKIRVIKRSDNTIHVEFSRGSNNIRLKPGQKVIFQGNNVLDIH